MHTKTAILSTILSIILAALYKNSVSITCIDRAVARVEPDDNSVLTEACSPKQGHQ